MTEVSSAEFGGMASHRVQRWTLSDGPTEVALLTYGGIIQSLRVPDRDGAPDDVVLGFDTIEGYLGEQPYFGATVGRFANRIAHGRFSLDGAQHQLPVNNGPNCLHGGRSGFDRQIWEANPVQGTDGVGVRLELVSPDGDNGFPGTLTVSLTVTLVEGTVRLRYTASTDTATVLNLTNHSYFNLSGAGSGTVEPHELQVAAGRYLPVNGDLIPTGELADVTGTPFDFRTPRPLGSRLREGHEQLARAQGYDHCLVLDREVGGGLSRCAEVHDPRSGRVLQVWTDQPGVQLYSGNFLDATLIGKGERIYRQTDALCLETQHFPDSPNQPGFPSTILRPDEEFSSTTELRFSAR